FVGYNHEFKDTGDAIPIKVAQQPILLVKNIKGNINAFHNVCSHRCVILVDQAKNVKKIISCPYHAWAYDLDGKLLASPHFGGTNKHEPKNFIKSDHGLKSIRVKVWHDWIFVNLNNNAPEFEDYAAPLINHLKDINLETIKPVATLDFGEIKTNWKFLIENFIEPYHVQFVHKKTTSQPLSDHYTIVDGICYGSGVDMEEEDSSSDNLAVTSKYLSLFPNFIIGTYFPGQLGVYLNTPSTTDRTNQKRIIYTTKGNDLSNAQIQKQKDLWWKVHKEDHEICERLQEGRSSQISLKGGLLSPYWEDSVRTFQQIVVKSMSKSKNRKKEENYV
ncbi:Rieske 2Fe-2S domain-containing protein, partial [Alphaproteobacteria bacterium]|nr:Rieske 2Fe-2S domain-containing protein [Alphaproteobacteria bacterium]